MPSAVKMFLFLFAMFALLGLMPEDWRLPVGAAILLLAMPFLLRGTGGRPSSGDREVTPARFLITLGLIVAGFTVLHYALAAAWREWTMVAWALLLTTVYSRVKAPSETRTTAANL